MKTHAILLILITILLSGCVVSHFDMPKFYSVSSKTPEGEKAIKENGIKYLSKSTYGLFWSDFYRKKGEFVYDIVELMDGSKQYKIVSQKDVDRLKLYPDFGVWNFFFKVILIITGIIYLIRWLIRWLHNSSKKKKINREYKGVVKNLILVFFLAIIFSSCENTQSLKDNSIESTKMSYPEIISIEKHSFTKEGVPILLLKLQIDSTKFDCLGLGGQALIEKVSSKKMIITSITLKPKDGFFIIKKIEVKRKIDAPLYWIFSVLDNHFLHDKAYNLSVSIISGGLVILFVLLIFKVGLVETILGIFDEM